MNRTSFFAMMGLSILAAFVLVACGANPAESTDGDSNGPGTDCSTNADCVSPTTNMTCNAAAAKCIDQGLCENDEQCAAWYGEGAACAASGLCGGGSPDGDRDGDGDVVDGDSGDGDTPVEGCEDFTGLYSGDFCGAAEDAYIVIDWINCTIQIVHGDEQMAGTVLGDEVTIASPSACEGERGQDRKVRLTCGDCQITLTPKSPNADQLGKIQVQPAELRFGAVYPGEPRQQEVVVSNLGEGDLTITSLFFTSETHEWFHFANPADWQLPKVLASGDDEMLVIEFDPDEEIATEGLAVILSDAQNTPIVRIKMSTSLKAVPRIEVDPIAVPFGSAPLGFENEKFFLVKSTGGATAQVVNIAMEDDQNGAFMLESFDTVNFEAKPPFDLESSFAKPVYLKFAPKQGVHEEGKTYTGRAKVVWINKDSAEETIFVDLIGKVVALSPPCLDVQPLGGWINFGGMGEVPGPGVKFGYSQIGVPTEREVTIHNCGDQPLTISNLTWQNIIFDNPPFTARAFFERPGAFQNYTLQRGETIYITISFLPPNEGLLYSSGFLFNTNATRFAWQPPNSPPPDPTMPVTVGVSGVGARRGIEVLPSKLDFGVVTIDCCSRPEELNIYNIGDLELVITEVKIGAGSDERFEVLGLPPLPIKLGGEGNPQSFSFEVKFCAEKEGPAEGRVEITSNDANGQFIVPLKGGGTTVTHQRDEFRQATHPMVDILWVIDCSGSMSEEQEKVADQTNYFVNEAVTWNADMHLALTSCDITSAAGHKGLMRGNPPVLANRGTGSLSTSQIISEFNSKVSGLGNGCDGGAQEAGLEAGHLALSEPLASNENKGFMRDDAKLAIIMVSDEEDQSVADVPFFIDFFRSLKGMRNVNMLEIYAIVGDAPSGCSVGSGDQGSSAAAGKRYISVADACNPHDDKHFYSICSEDYHPVFESLSENLFALRNQFFLSRLADPETIVVTVDGRTVDNWEYDEETNSIVFPEDEPPDPGATVVVEYDTLCLQ